MMMLHVFAYLSLYSNSDTLAFRVLSNCLLCWNIMTGLLHSSVDSHLNQYICDSPAKRIPENEHGITAQSPASADTSASLRVTQRLFEQYFLTLVDGPVNREKHAHILHPKITNPDICSCLLQHLAHTVHTSHRHHQHYPEKNKHPYSIMVIMITSDFKISLSTFPPSSVNVKHKQMHKEIYIKFWPHYMVINCWEY